MCSDPRPGHERFRNFLAIPYLAHDGHPVQIRFRCLEAHTHRDYGHGKYMTIPDDPPRIYNVGAIHRAANELHVTEGELDAIILNKVGLPAVGLPGADLWQGHHRRMLAGFSRIFVWGDPDEAGSKMVNKLCRQLGAARGVKLTHGDVGETYVMGGADALMSALKGSV